MTLRERTGNAVLAEGWLGALRLRFTMPATVFLLKGEKGIVLNVTLPSSRRRSETWSASRSATRT
jgi:hypothetical protein